MRNIILSTAAAIGVAALSIGARNAQGAPAPGAIDTAAVQSGTYTADAAHSMVAWHVSHLGGEALAKYPDDADMARMEYARSLESNFDLRDSDLIQALPGLYRDLLSAAWHRIDWEALAGTWLEDFT